MENKGTNGKVQRGEIYLYDFGNNGGSIQNGVRPALVVQCDEGNAASSTTIIAAMTSIIKKQYLPSHIILGDRFGLKEPSMVMLEQLKTVNQSDLIEYIGKIDDEHYMKKINIGIKKAMGLWVDIEPKRDFTCIRSAKQFPESAVFHRRWIFGYDLRPTEFYSNGELGGAGRGRHHHCKGFEPLW